MGWCYEFGPQIGEHCDHPMMAGERSCTCTACGAVCTGRFGGCGEVWARRSTMAVLERPHRPPVLRFVERTEGACSVDPIETRVAVAPAAAARGVAEHDGSAEVLDWLKRAFAEIHGELRSLAMQVHDHQRALETGVNTSAGAVEIADEVMARIEAGLAVKGAPSAPDEDARTSAEALRHSIDEVHQLTDQLRMEMARLAAFRRALADANPALAGLVDRGSLAAEARHETRA